MKHKVLITGSAGLIGSESVRFFSKKGFEVFGIDNNMRARFFGKDASTLWQKKELQRNYPQYTHLSIDIRNKKAIDEIIQAHTFDLIIHAAAQPSHDWAAQDPLTDFSVNANGTLNLLEAYRQYNPEAIFIFTSTNKVYGDRPNSLPLQELETRYEISTNHEYFPGINESMSIDNTKHSLFGSSKLAADILVQEYGKYFGLHTTVLRGGCLTGPAHSGTHLHGFLSYLAKCIIKQIPYTIYGYEGKQVRDNIHSYDFVNALFHIYNNPKKGEVYNLGGSRHSHISMIEAIKKIENLTGKKAQVSYQANPRIGDHKWYISDVSKFQSHYPSWNYTYTIDAIIEEIIAQGHFT